MRARLTQSARRHEISNQLLFAWRKAYLTGRLGTAAGFVPAMFVAEPPAEDGASGCGRIEIVSTNGRRVIGDWPRGGELAADPARA